MYPKRPKSKLLREYKEFLIVRKLLQKTDQAVTQTTIDRYDVFIEKRDKMYDIFGDNIDDGLNSQRCKGCVKRCEQNFGVKMSDKEYEYLESQRNDGIPRNKKL